jgi:uncharacterized protein (TIGR04141 family)
LATRANSRNLRDALGVTTLPWRYSANAAAAACPCVDFGDSSFQLQPHNRWSLYDCVHAELENAGKTFVLSAGRWYQVHRSLVDDVNQFFKDVKRLSSQLPPYQDKDEAAYCKRVGATGTDWAVMDRKPIRYGGGRSQVEFCDLFSGSGKTLLHIKRYGGSAPLSHLFAQALVSGETFKLETDFRQKLNTKLPARHRLTSPVSSPEGFRVVLGVIKAGSFDLPFFAKVTLRNTAKRLAGYGFKVLLAPIGVDQAFAITKKVPKKNP